MVIHYLRRSFLNIHELMPKIVYFLIDGDRDKEMEFLTRLSRRVLVELYLFWNFLFNMELVYFFFFFGSINYGVLNVKKRVNLTEAQYQTLYRLP